MESSVYVILYAILYVNADHARECMHDFHRQNANVRCTADIIQYNVILLDNKTTANLITVYSVQMIDST